MKISSRPHDGPRRCLGYEETEGKCENEAGTPWTPITLASRGTRCPACDERRRAAITKSLEGLVAGLIR